MQGSVSISPLEGVPDIRPGDDLAIIIGDCLKKSFEKLIDGDVICIAHKIFSKAEGNVCMILKMFCRLRKLLAWQKS